MEDVVLSLDESFLEKLRSLPPDKQREAIDFVDILSRELAPAFLSNHRDVLLGDVQIQVCPQSFQAQSRCF